MVEVSAYELRNIREGMSIRCHDGRARKVVKVGPVNDNGAHASWRYVTVENGGHNIGFNIIQRRA